MAAKKRKGNYMIFVWIFVGIALVVGGFIGYNTQIKPLLEMTKTVEEKDLAIKELEAENLLLKEMIEMNQTITETTEVQRLGFGGMLGWFLTFLFGGALFYMLLIKPQQDIKLRHKVIEYMRKYAKEKDSIEVHRVVDDNFGYFDGNLKWGVYLVLFCTSPTWIPTEEITITTSSEDKTFDLNTFIEPDEKFIFGYYGNSKNLDDVKKTFRGKSVKDVYKSLQGVEWGREPPYPFPKKKSTYAPDEDIVNLRMEAEKIKLMAEMVKE